jgi:hypothetical protein
MDFEFYDAVEAVLLKKDLFTGHPHQTRPKEKPTSSRLVP